MKAKGTVFFSFIDIDDAIIKKKKQININMTNILTVNNKKSFKK